MALFGRTATATKVLYQRGAISLCLNLTSKGKKPKFRCFEIEDLHDVFLF